MSSHRTTTSSPSSPSTPSKSSAPSLRISILTIVLLLLTTAALTTVSAKGGHFPAAVTDTSGPCIDRCSVIYKNEMTNCMVKFPSPNLDPYGRNNCNLDVANMFQRCSQSCIPAAATFPNSQ